MFQLFFFGFFIDFHHIWEMECCKLCEIESHFERGKGNGRVTVRVRVTVKEGWWKSFWGSVRVTFLEGGWWESLWRWESLWEREGESHFERGRVRVTLREGEPLWEEESERERERESESHFEGGRVRVRDMTCWKISNGFFFGTNTCFRRDLTLWHLTTEQQHGTQTPTHL